MAKFFFFEKIVQLFYTHVFTQPKETYGKGTQLGVTFASGYLAGVVCAIVSHPADSLVSQLGKAENKGKSIGTIAKEVGVVSLATKGLGTRVIMIGQYSVSSRAPKEQVIKISLRVLRYPHWLPMVDLRYLQVCHGYGYHRWQIIIPAYDTSLPSFVRTSCCVNISAYLRCVSRSLLTSPEYPTFTPYSHLHDIKGLG